MEELCSNIEACLYIRTNLGTRYYFNSYLLTRYLSAQDGAYICTQQFGPTSATFKNK